MCKRDMQARFAHDGCSHCQFIGHRDGFDIYVCRGHDRTIIARFGNEGSEYASGALFITKGEFFREPKHWTNVAAGVLAQYVLDTPPA